jgi:hypothetical protein
MSKISKYNQAIFACSAIVVASLGSFVQSASAGIGSDNGAVIPPTPVTIYSNPGNPTVPVTIQSNPGNPNPGTIQSDPGNGKPDKPVKPGKPPVTIGSDPTNPPGNPPITIGSDPNNPNPQTKPGEKPKPNPVTIGSDNGNPTPTGSNAGGISSVNGSNAGSDGGGGRFSSSTIATAKGVQGKFLAAMSKYEIASAALAAAEAGQNNASSNTSPVRYGREPGDIAACGCPNADLTAGTPSKELVAAKAAEAEAAAELAAAKAEARQFLESVKENGSTGITFQPVW